MAEIAIAVQGKTYAPVITTPYQLKEKLAQLKIYCQKNQKANEYRGILSLKDL